jgi:hypothetical protein
MFESTIIVTTWLREQVNLLFIDTETAVRKTSAHAAIRTHQLIAIAILVIQFGGGPPDLKLDPAVTTAFPSPTLKPALACQNKVKQTPTSVFQAMHMKS